MPLVFVHGVAVRRGESAKDRKKFDDAVSARDELFRTIALRSLVPPPALARIENPYWGDDAAKFAYDLVTVPSHDVEMFGPTDSDVAQVLMETVPPAVAMKASADEVGADALLLTLAREASIAHAVDALVAASAVDVPDDAGSDDAAKIAEFGAWAVRYAESVPEPAWLRARHPATGQILLRSDADFLDALAGKVEDFRGASATHETFGGFSILGRLKRTAGQISTIAKRTVKAIASATVGGAVGAVAGAAIGGLPGPTLRALRPAATRRAGTFFGDVFTYLHRRTLSRTSSARRSMPRTRKRRPTWTRNLW